MLLKITIKVTWLDGDFSVGAVDVGNLELMDGTFRTVSLVFPTEDAVCCVGEFLVPSGGFSKTTFRAGHEMKDIKQSSRYATSDVGLHKKV